jgi:excisionase family DNA binding protein
MVPFSPIFLGLVEGGVSFMDEKRSYTVKELQQILEVSRPAIYELLKEKRFEWAVVGGKYRISKKSFDKWFDGDAAG